MASVCSAAMDASAGPTSDSYKALLSSSLVGHERASLEEYWKECYRPYEEWLNSKKMTVLIQQTDPEFVMRMCGPEPPVPPGYLAWFAQQVWQEAWPEEKAEAESLIATRTQESKKKMLQVEFGLSEAEADEPDLLDDARFQESDCFWRWRCMTVARRTEQPMEPEGTIGNPSWELLSDTFCELLV